MRKRTFTISIDSGDAVVTEGKQRDLVQFGPGECRREKNEC